MQTLSRGLWGTCCPSGGGEAWNETTPQQVTGQHDSLSKRADDNGQVWLVSSANELRSLSPTDKIPDRNQKGCSVSIRYTRRYIYKYSECGWVSDTAVVWLLYGSKAHSKCDCVFSTSWCPQTRCRILNWHTPVHTESTAAKKKKKLCLVCRTKTSPSHNQASLDAGSKIY